ncbi:MAG: FAD:protein FMN transferase, partial [Muribaculaceae bacterium]|nr:FAD:protein FMN transferase [Muribaculaceae bacterium]
LGGKRYCHILDPRTGMPVETDAESVTLVACSSADCDGFSTTVCALGIERGATYASGLPEIEAAIFVDSDNRVRLE